MRTAASVFSKAEVIEGLRVEDFSSEWVLRKASIALSFCGGLRGAELRSLNLGDLTEGPDGYWVRYTPAKQAGEVKDNSFLVPWNKNDKSKCFATRLQRYLQDLKKALPDLQPEDALFKRVMPKGYGSTAMGKNYLSNTGKILATHLGLANPGSYTGHCWRRSSATAAANRGATNADLQRQYNWKNEKTAMR